MKRLFLILFFVVPVLSWGQNYSVSNGKAIKLFEKGQTALYQGNGSSAIHYLEQALEVEPDFIEAKIMLAEWYLDTKNDDMARQYYYSAVNTNPTFFTLAWLQLGELELKDSNFDKAKSCYETFLKIDRKNTDRHARAKYGISCIEFRKYALSHPVDFKPENLGSNINSPDDEYLPTLTVDGETLIFTRRFPRKPTTSALGDEEEDFYISHLVEGSWAKAVRMEEPVNSNDNEGAQCISQDGRIMFFTACGRQDGVGRCDLYMCTRKGDKWSKPRNMGTPVNSGSWESQPTFSIDGRTLYFVSDRKGGYGGMDIWKTTFGKEGWSAPVNMGPSINTAGDEMSPFIHFDDNTLYFASNGHVGMGGMDLFCSRRQDDGTWGQPQNLGYPINTSGDETNLIVSADGHTAFYSSNREGGYGKQDLYRFSLPEQFRPVITLCLRGVVTDAKTGARVSAQIQVIDVATSEVIATTNSDPLSGDFQISLPALHDYAIHATAKNYFFFSEHYELEKGMDDHYQWAPVETNISMQRIESGECIALRNVFFDFGTSTLHEHSQLELNKLIDVLNNNPSLRIELGGHTDNIGRPEDNLKLSEARAKAVLDYLVSKGISASRLTSKGYGETVPIADNSTPEGREQNRRTEIKIL